jgi:hypothetical protein
MILEVFAEYEIQGQTYLGHFMAKNNGQPVGLRVLRWLKAEFGDRAELLDWCILPS